MTTTSAHLKVYHHTGATWIQLRDRCILDQPIIDQISDEIIRLIDQDNNPKILLDFKNVEQLSSAALGALIRVNQQIKDKCGQLRLANVAGHLQEIFEMTRLDRLFQMHDDSEAAIDSFT